MADNSKEEFLNLIKRVGAFLTVKISNLLRDLVLFSLCCYYYYYYFGWIFYFGKALWKIFYMLFVDLLHYLFTILKTCRRVSL